MSQFQSSSNKSHLNSSQQSLSRSTSWILEMGYSINEKLNSNSNYKYVKYPYKLIQFTKITKWCETS